MLWIKNKVRYLKNNSKRERTQEITQNLNEESKKWMKERYGFYLVSDQQEVVKIASNGLACTNSKDISQNLLGINTFKLQQSIINNK